MKNFSDRNACAGGTVFPIPTHDGHGASCNHCACNAKNTSCGDVNPAFGHPCKSGWYPDPLLAVPASGIPSIPKGFTQPIYLELCIPRGQQPGNYTGTIEVAAGGSSLFSVPAKVEVWDLTLPHLNDSSAFNTAFNFNSNMSRWYPEGTSPETWWGDWLPFLAHHRVPGDSIYLGGPRPVAEYEALAASGAKWMGMVSTTACERFSLGWVWVVTPTVLFVPGRCWHQLPPASQWHSAGRVRGRLDREAQAGDGQPLRAGHSAL